MLDRRSQGVDLSELQSNSYLIPSVAGDCGFASRILGVAGHWLLELVP